MHLDEVIEEIINLANIARSSLALEEYAEELQDDFLHKGIMLMVDKKDPELVRKFWKRN